MAPPVHDWRLLVQALRLLWLHRSCRTARTCKRCSTAWMGGACEKEACWPRFCAFSLHLQPPLLAPPSCTACDCLQPSHLPNVFSLLGLVLSPYCAGCEPQGVNCSKGQCHEQGCLSAAFPHLPYSAEQVSSRLRESLRESALPAGPAGLQIKPHNRSALPYGV